MGLGGAFMLLVFGLPMLLAFAAGFVSNRRPIVAGAGSVAVLAGLLTVTSPHGLVAMAPFAALVGAIALIPAIIAALIGSRIRSRLKKEA